MPPTEAATVGTTDSPAPTGAPATLGTAIAHVATELREAAAHEGDRADEVARADVVLSVLRGE